MKRFILVTFIILNSSLVLSVVAGFFILPPQAAAYTTNMYASVVIGQPNFTSNSSNQGGSAGAHTLRLPRAATVCNKRLIIADYNNNRVLIYNSIPTSNNASADVVIGQQDFSSVSVNQGGSVAANTLNTPSDVLCVNEKLLIADRDNDRILIYNRIPTQNNASADIVIGQPNLTSNGANQNGSCAANTLWLHVAPGLTYDGQRLYISDSVNARILIYNNIPTTNNASASLVLGQNNFTSCSNDQGGSAGANTIDGDARHLYSDGKRLYFADFNNNRVLIWNSLPTANGQAADVVAGQQDFTSTSNNQGGNAAANTVRNPACAVTDNRGRLYICDTNNDRILIFNSIPTSNNASADIIIGQTNFTGDGANQNGSVGANTLSNPTGEVAIYENKLIVPDPSNHRVLIFEDIPDTPKAIFTSSPEQQPDGRMRFSGDVSLSGGKHSIWKIEASVNGGPFGEVTSLWDTVRTNPGIPDDIIAKFYHDVTPWENDNSTQDKWTEDIGYTVRFKVYSTNVDLADPFFYFTPFTLNSVKPIKFSVNSKQINLLKDNLDHYEVWVKKDIWTKHIDQIPISYDLARDKEDNLLKILDNTLPEGGNGIYENGNLKATYTNDSATIEVSSKLTSLTLGTYQIKVIAVDKYGYSQETLPQELVIPDPFPYHVNPKKPRVKSVLVENFDFATPQPAPRPSPSLIPASPAGRPNHYPLTPILDFLDALFH